MRDTRALGSPDMAASRTFSPLKTSCHPLVYHDDGNYGADDDDYDDNDDNDDDKDHDGNDDDAARGGRGRTAKLVGRPLVIGTWVHPLTYKPPPLPTYVRTGKIIRGRMKILIMRPGSPR